jgi:dUTP pyrophosphatase
MQYDEVVKIKFVKTHPEAKLPTKAHAGDNCYDLYCCERTVVPGSRVVDGTFKVGQALIPVGLTVAYISPGFGFATKNKSGLSFKHLLQRVAGEMDNGYRGDVGVKLLNFSDKDYTFEVGDKVTQFKIEKIYPTEISFTEDIEEAVDARGEGGFGSSGKQ